MSNSKFNCQICLLDTFNVLYLKRCVCSKNPRKGRKLIMRHNVNIEERKSFIIKIIFFIIILLFTLFMYFETKMIIDAVYFITIFALFIRFLWIKLYQ